MELMDESLTSYLERSADPRPPLPLHVQVDIGHDVAQALSHLHRHKVLHRDLSSNNVLLIGSRRAKVTDFGMAKLLGSDPRLTPTYCPGTNGYMSPEALVDPPSYTSKLDVFSCGVLLVQIITRRFPDPGPRTSTIQINDPRVPLGQVLVVTPELERRKEHLDLISPTHPLLKVALDCLKDKEGQRPTAEQLCSHLIALKESAAYRDNLQQTTEGKTSETHPTRELELEKQLRKSESRVEDLTREVQQLTVQNEEQARSIQQRDGLVKRMCEERQLLRQQIQEKSETIPRQLRNLHEKDNEIQQLQQDTRLQAKEELLQEKKREIQDSQQVVRGREGSGVVVRHLKLTWKDGPPTSFETYGHSVAVRGENLYCCHNSVKSTEVLTFNSKTGQWKIAPRCAKYYFSIVVVNGQLTAVGGEDSGKSTNTLLSLKLDQKWAKQFPPMKYCRNGPAVAVTNSSLVVAGGWTKDLKLSEIEVMDIRTFQWTTLASLPHPLSEATATICEGKLYLGGGFGSGVGNATKSVIMCQVKDLQSQTTRPSHSSSHSMWREVAPLPKSLSSLVTFQGQLLAVGGSTTGKGANSTSEVRQYNAATNSWSVISQLRSRRCLVLAAVLPDNTLMVCGGWTPVGRTNSVEIASAN